MDALWQLLWELWKVCNGIQAVCLYGVAVGEKFIVVCNDFCSCNPAFNQNAVVSYFAEDEVVGRVVVGVDKETPVGVLC